MYLQSTIDWGEKASDKMNLFPAPPPTLYICILFHLASVPNPLIRDVHLNIWHRRAKQTLLFKEKVASVVRKQEDSAHHKTGPLYQN